MLKFSITYVMVNNVMSHSGAVSKKKNTHIFYATRRSTHVHHCFLTQDDEEEDKTLTESTEKKRDVIVKIHMRYDI